jgi:hypothetical protein
MTKALLIELAYPEGKYIRTTGREIHAGKFGPPQRGKG